MTLFCLCIELRLCFEMGLLNRGRPIYVEYDGGFIRAFDSVFQAGIFNLEQGDQLRVELDDFSRNCRIVPHADRTFFGGLFLQSDLISAQFDDVYNNEH